MTKHNKGWPNEPGRHVLSSYDIETTAKGTTKENEIERPKNKKGKRKVIKDIKDGSQTIYDGCKIYETTIIDEDGKIDDGHFLQVQQYFEDGNEYWLTYVHDQSEGYGWIFYDEEDVVDKANKVLKEIRKEGITYDEIVDWADYCVWSGTGRIIPHNKKLPPKYVED